MEKFFTYILFSHSSNKHYYGHTSDLSKRLFEHNNTSTGFTKKYAPWELIYFEEFNSRSDAMKREKYFKSFAGYKWLKENKII